MVYTEYWYNSNPLELTGPDTSIVDAVFWSIIEEVACALA